MTLEIADERCFLSSGSVHDYRANNQNVVPFDKIIIYIDSNFLGCVSPFISQECHIICQSAALFQRPSVPGLALQW